MKISDIVAAIERLHPKWDNQRVIDRASIVDQTVRAVEADTRFQAEKAKAKEAHAKAIATPGEWTPQGIAIGGPGWRLCASDGSPTVADIERERERLTACSDPRRPMGVTPNQWIAYIRDKVVPEPWDQLTKVYDWARPDIFDARLQSCYLKPGWRVDPWTSKKGIIPGDMFDIDWNGKALDDVRVRVFGENVHPDSFRDIKAWRRVHVADVWIDCIGVRVRPIFLGTYDPSTPCIIRNAQGQYVYGRLGSVAWGNDQAIRLVLE